MAANSRLRYDPYNLNPDIKDPKNLYYAILFQNTDFQKLIMSLNLNESLESWAPALILNEFSLRFFFFFLLSADLESHL